MENKISGLHHITAIAGDPQPNYDFYTRILGLRMIKQTVNFDDPQTYHLYYGDEVGTPGAILTFFPWPGARRGKNGAGMATETGYAVPKGSLDFWKKRFETYDITHDRLHERFGEKYLPFRDPDGLWLSLIEPKTKDNRIGWEIPGITPDHAIRGFHSITLTLNSTSQTADLLTSVFGYKYAGKDGNLHRYQTDAVEHAAIVDMLESPGASKGLNAAGTIHHVAFRVKDPATDGHTGKSAGERPLCHRTNRSGLLLLGLFP